MNPAIVDGINQMAEELRNDLAKAYGGFCNISEKEIVEALKGRFVNGSGLFFRCTFAEKVLEAALDQQESRWETLVDFTGDHPETAVYWYARRDIVKYEFAKWLEEQRRPKVSKRLVN